MKKRIIILFVQVWLIFLSVAMMSMLVITKAYLFPGHKMIGLIIKSGWILLYLSVLMFLIPFFIINEKVDKKDVRADYFWLFIKLGAFYLLIANGIFLVFIFYWIDLSLFLLFVFSAACKYKSFKKLCFQLQKTSDHFD